MHNFTMSSSNVKVKRKMKINITDNLRYCEPIAVQRGSRREICWRGTLNRLAGRHSQSTAAESNVRAETGAHRST